MKRTPVAGGLGRRRFLLGAGGAALALPFLESMRPARAAPGDYPQRLVIFYHDAGTLVDEWRPSGVGSSFELSPILSPLEPFKDKLVVLSGLKNDVRELCTGSNGHVAPKTTLLTAAPFFGGQTGQAWADGPSIDQLIADRMGPVTAKKTVDVWAGSNYGGYEGVISFSGPDAPVSSATNDPVALFQDLFAGFDDSDTDAQEKQRARQVAILDAVQDNFGSYRKGLSGADRIRLDAHAAYVAELEERVKNAGLVGCTVPPEPGPVDGAAHDQMLDALGGLVAYSLACDITRVSTIYAGTQQNSQFDWTGATIPGGDWHGMVHGGPGEDGSQDRETRRTVFRWHMDALARLLQQMDDVKEGPDGESVLDHSLVLALSEFGNGAAHATNELPVVLAGGLSGAVKTGQHLVFQDRNHSDLLLTLLRLFGHDDPTFGVPDFCTGPLSGVGA